MSKYLSSEQLSKALIESQQLGHPTEEVCNYFKMIAQHLLTCGKFKGYHRDLKEEMISEALLKCIKNIKNFKSEYSDKSFNYFTRCVEHAFFATLDKYYKHKNLIDELILEYSEECKPTSQEFIDYINQLKGND